jgi:hypothetical protein
MKGIIIFITILACISCIGLTNNVNKGPKEERIVIEITEKTDSLYKKFKPKLKTANSLRVIMKGRWNDTIMMHDAFLPADTVEHNTIQPYTDQFPPSWTNFNKYKATKYYIRIEYIFSEAYFTSYKDNY